MVWSDRSRRPAVQAVQFKISDFGSEMGFCPISDFSVPLVYSGMLLALKGGERYHDFF